MSATEKGESKTESLGMFPVTQCCINGLTRLAFLFELKLLQHLRGKCIGGKTVLDEVGRGHMGSPWPVELATNLICTGP